MGIKLNPYLRDFWKDKREIKVLYGGRSSSKTEDVAGMLTYISANYRVKIACIRMFQANITQSVYSVLKRKIESDEEYKEKFKFTINSIVCTTTGSEFIFFGWERNTDQIKGLDGIDIMWVEEGHTLNKEKWEIIEPTISLRKNFNMIIIVFNPNLISDFVYQRFVLNPPSNCLAKKVNYLNNPFLPQKALDIIEEKKREDYENYEHIYLGEPRQDSENSFIKRRWLEACIDSHIKLNVEPTGKDVIGYDVADDGEDKNATAHRKGILLHSLEEWKGGIDELEKSHTRVFLRANRCKGHIIYDTVGVGASAGSTFNRLNIRKTITHQKFNAGAGVEKPKAKYEGVLNKDYFANLKAQTWQNVADRCRKTFLAVTKGEAIEDDEIISISSNIETEQLFMELCTPRKEEDNTGKIKVESKKDLAKRGIRSPNLADAFIMCYAQFKTNTLLTAHKTDKG